jgi:hypothetical protein
MKGSNSKMLQIPLKRQLPAPKCYKFHQNSANAMENERFQLQNVAKTVEMAVSSRKMLQIARKTGRKIDPPQKKNNTEKKQNNSGPIFDPFGCISRGQNHRPTKKLWVNIVFLPESLVSSSVAPGFLVSTGSAPLDWVAKHSNEV